MAEDLSKDPEFVEWAEDVLNSMAPAMRESALVMTLVPDDRVGDVKFWVELGASTMMDKPLIAVIFNDEPLPPKLGRIADQVLRIDREDMTSEAGQEKIVSAIERIEGRGGG